jgi:hypothetical protein
MENNLYLCTIILLVFTLNATTATTTFFVALKNGKPAAAP